MNKHLLPIGIIIIFSCSKPINEKSLVERNGVIYPLNSDKPFSGKFFSVYENRQKRRKVHSKKGY